MSERTGPPPDLAEGRRLLMEARADGPMWDITLRRDAAEHWLFDHADALLADAEALTALLPVVRECRDLLMHAARRGEQTFLPLAVVRAIGRLDQAIPRAGGEGRVTTDQRTTPEQRVALRSHYLADPGPASCPACEERMELEPPERATIGVLWTWRCPKDPEHPRLRHIDPYADLDVIALCDDADALAGARAEIERFQSLVDACVEVLGHAMIRSDGYALHLAGFRVWEMLTGATEVPKAEGTDDGNG